MQDTQMFSKFNFVGKCHTTGKTIPDPMLFFSVFPQPAKRALYWHLSHLNSVNSPGNLCYGVSSCHITKSRGPKGLQIEVGARRSPRLLVISYLKLVCLTQFLMHLSACLYFGQKIKSPTHHVMMWIKLVRDINDKSQDTLVTNFITFDFVVNKLASPR